MRLRASLLPLTGLALLGSCHKQASGPIEASLIQPRAATALKDDPPPALLAATDQGLVRLDRDGQIVPGAAVRWAILENGLDYIFRIDDSGGVTAQKLARKLRAALRSAPAPLKAVLASIESVTAVTSTVIEIRLSMPEPDLLTLLARPEFGLGAGGPMRIARRNGSAMILRPDRQDEGRIPPLLLHIDPVGRAVARFVQGGARYVGGGTFADLPVAQVATLPRGALVFDTATGLFGLVPLRDEGPAANPLLRQALGLAIDRDRIVSLIGARGLTKATTLAGSAIEPPLSDRVAEARRLLTGVGEMPAVRVAMPEGPGARLLFALLAQDWSRIGVAATPVKTDDEADFALIDMVAPPASLAALACAASAGCDPGDRLAVLNPPYIPIASPVRWSLVDRKLDGFGENALASHPLDQLRRTK